MTTFVQAAMGTPRISNPTRAYTRTENGMRTPVSSMSANVDLFAQLGAARGKNLTRLFESAFQENPDIAMRILQYARDIREGQGERKFFRDILLHLEAVRPDILLDSHVLSNIPALGRFDDLLIFTNAEVKAKAFAIIRDALKAENGLAAKWMPRKGPVAAELRAFLGLTPKGYRKTLVNLTNVVETKMCARQWDTINFSHVPSQAMSRYMTAFHRNAPVAFEAFKAELRKDPKDRTKSVKVNAGAVYPYTPIKMLTARTYGYYGQEVTDNRVVANEMWKNLPDFLAGSEGKILPIVDVSGSMVTKVAEDGATALDVAVSLGLYVSERNPNPAFKDVFMTFSTRPQFVKTQGTLSERINQMITSSWQMTTNLHAAFDLLLSRALEHNLPQSAMPEMLLIMSDMQFNQCNRHDDTALQMVRRKYEAAGYAMPRVVFWNIAEKGGKPARASERDVALVGGFSPSILKSLLTADIDKFTPEGVMLNTVNIERYNW